MYILKLFFHKYGKFRHKDAEATGEIKKELSKIKNLDEISSYGSSYFDSPKNFIEFLEVGGRVSVLLAKLNPDNFAANQNVSSYYISTALLDE
jgi:hypothetical protein